ncbi:protein of unknown function DUF554 [Gottschalkia acidurici 9a]|uniref:DUF554 domain-containing protein n=1 Tax=Gottschalkia acidurici (strain ATCC 7906 / DSM 604 / BCRC 14475 / CIP 104303 / KCTC 5404 / NCIMB 10678 / 9a) TaxID=1128398 RepID=K0AU61_GOTA9|nr:DUF554 domain-containing protein [Gottschalkia acidurici]AFS77373.1 protein of unknown function DUF554 [Gottschalkia acidurici 9a]
MLGVIVNVLAIIVGGTLGLIFKRFIKESYKETIMNGLGLSVIIMGIMSAIKSKEFLLVIVSIVLGSLIGEILDIEGKLNKLGEFMGSKFSKDSSNDSSFSKAFVTTSLIFCVGAMGILGSLESGLSGNHQTLYAKSILDGVSSTIFSSTLGIGVLFSTIPVLIYQGSIVLAASLIKGFLTDPMITEISAVGGILIIAIGLNVLNIKNIKIGNMLPSILIPVIYFMF